MKIELKIKMKITMKNRMKNQVKIKQKKLFQKKPNRSKLFQIPLVQQQQILHGI